MVRAPHLFVDGTAVKGDAGTYPVTNPVRPEEVVVDAPAATGELLDVAVAAAGRAQREWGCLAFGERSAMVVRAAEAATAAAGDGSLARLLTAEHGKVLWEAEFEVGTVGAMAGAFSPLAEAAMAGRTEDSGATQTRIVEEPCGVVAAILPFNWPAAVFANKVIPALLTGNTVVVKAPPTCPGAVLSVAAAFAESLPPGVVNTVNGPGRDLGESLVVHPGVDMVSFTGGVETGRSVMRGASAGLKRVVLELGGNDPAIVAEDQDIDEEMARRIVEAAFLTSGQVCMAIKRLYVPLNRVASTVDALAAHLATYVVGDGLADEVTMGPVHTARARDRVESMLDEAAAAGARVHRPACVREADVAAGGYLVSPAVVESPPPGARIVREEQFAPALPVLGYRDLDEAVGMANASPFGLCASVWTADGNLAATVANRLQAGTVFVNSHGISAVDYRAPFGGWKQSGSGVELGLEGMAAFTRPKTIVGLADPPR